MVRKIGRQVGKVEGEKDGGGKKQDGFQRAKTAVGDARFGGWGNQSSLIVIRETLSETKTQIRAGVSAASR